MFKLLRLKSSRLLRSYRRRPPTRVQKCSQCKQVGHNSQSKSCPGRVLAQVEVATDYEDHVTAEVFQDGDQEALDDSLFDVDDLLGGSGDELF